ncbi:hypothetical protein IG631_23594 [Alternaria alternata]|nr:hypothetical protein IG631_23594 [Alternaria alternata]
MESEPSVLALQFPAAESVDHACPPYPRQVRSGETPCYASASRVFTPVAACVSFRQCESYVHTEGEHTLVAAVRGPERTVMGRMWCAA